MRKTLKRPRTQRNSEELFIPLKPLASFASSAPGLDLAEQGTRRNNYRMRTASMVLVVALSLACSDDGVTGSSTVTGTYTLRTINGSPLPYTVPGSGAVKTEILSDAITLFQGGTFGRVRDSRVTDNGQVLFRSETETGSYTLLGTSITLNSIVTGKPTLATINGNIMTIVEPGATSVFSK